MTNLTRFCFYLKVKYEDELDWLGLWCLTPLSTSFQLYRDGLLYWCRKTGVPGEKHRPAASYGQTSSHNFVSSTPL